MHLPHKYQAFEQQFKELNDFKSAKTLVQSFSFELWENAKQRIVKTNNYDDRELYWARLLSSKVIRTTSPKFSITQAQLNTLLPYLRTAAEAVPTLLLYQAALKKYYLRTLTHFYSIET